jgi:hypothetical protein
MDTRLRVEDYLTMKNVVDDPMKVMDCAYYA